MLRRCRGTGQHSFVGRTCERGRTGSGTLRLQRWIRTSLAPNTADVWSSLEDGHVVLQPTQDTSGGNASETCAYNGDRLHGETRRGKRKGSNESCIKASCHAGVITRNAPTSRP